MSESIFVPLSYNKSGLFLALLQTFDKPYRYFQDKNQNELKPFWDLHNGPPAKIEEASPIIVNERFSWDVTYCIRNLGNKDLKYLNGNSVKILPISSLNSIFDIKMPAELQLALLTIVTKELNMNELISGEVV